MNRTPHGWARVPVLAAALLGTAGAQDLGAYRQLAGNLDGAVRARAESAQAALARLDAATQALTLLKPTLRNRQLAAGLDDAMSSARAALARTPAELEAQVMLARGLMRKALYDQTLAQLVAGPANGTAQLQLLTREFGLSPEGTKAVMTENKTGHAERVAWRLQRAAASRVLSSLKATRPERTTASYVSLARATSWFTVLQDTAGSSGLKVSQFGDALRQLTSGQTTELAASLGVLRQGASALVASLVPEPRAITRRPQASGGDATPAVVVRAPVAVDSARSSVAGTPVTAGITQSADASPLYAALGRALAAAGHGDNAAARTELARATVALADVPASLRTARGYTDLVFNITAAQSRTALRVSDVQALIGQAANLEAAAAGRAPSTLDAVSGSVARSFSGWLRVLVFLLLAALAAVPLYLLNLAFGARNTYWRAVMVGTGLLLLPVFLEGVFGLLGALGDVSGAGALRGAANVTLSQGAYGLPVWALLCAVAIALMSYGFRGLCQQFGLMGSVGAARHPTQSGLEWDEDL
ncbi:hypothetical protein HNQ07_003891 [Deinococcus metalli]|uniref:Uncharacterized protein n=1 Tax=Deinococcus metalli TaxID=1141878 RepID=A0A7W8KHT4_9DEIO|nr:hypothetical protein [Deinococcus metalli]MBB5378385.1 hypothetical protein [Deinococcus metalli]GHF59302.1 hypothetical protein GCM10017781_39460 [Deinococcus metalli]